LEYFDFHASIARLFILGVHVTNPGIPCGLPLAVYALAARRVDGISRAVVGACLWVGSEWLRTWSLGWELLAHTQFRHLALIQIADLGGAYAVSFVVALASISAAEVLSEMRAHRRAATFVGRQLALPVAALITVLIYGTWAWQAYDEASTVAVPGGPDVRS